MSVEIRRNPPDDGKIKLAGNECETLPELEASFSVGLFPEGFLVGKALEKGAHEGMEFVYPYDGGIESISSPASITSVKSDEMMIPEPTKESMDNFMQLITVAQRNGLSPRRRKMGLLPHSDDQNASPSLQLLPEALVNTLNDDIRDPQGQRSMADSLVGGVNVRKTRFLLFKRSNSKAPGTHHRDAGIRLVMCERDEDALVDAMVKFGDGRDNKTLNSAPHNVLPTMASVHAADIFAKQFRALLEKEGFELVEDKVQPTRLRGNITANAVRPYSSCAAVLDESSSSPQSFLIDEERPARDLGMAGIAPMQSSLPKGLSRTQILSPHVSSSSAEVSADGYTDSDCSIGSQPCATAEPTNDSGEPFADSIFATSATTGSMSSTVATSRSAEETVEYGKLGSDRSCRHSS